MSAQRPQNLLGSTWTLEADIREGLFTPFLGAGASSLWSGEIDLGLYPWNNVTMTLTAIASRLGDRSRDFLRSFAKHRLSLSAKDATTIIPPIDQPLPRTERPDLSDSLLVKLQAELVKTTVSLTNYFGTRLSQENPTIHVLENCGVEFDLDSEDIVGALARDCPARLLAAIDIAFELRQKKRPQRESPFLEHVEGIDRRLRLQELYAKLIILLEGLVGCNYKVVENGLGRHILQLSEEGKKSPKSSGRLRLDAIQWLSDLIWYTLRYWVPCYPTTAELAFELSSALHEGPPRRAELPQAAQALENLGSGVAAKIVGSLFSYCENVQARRRVPDRQMRAFYYSIAAAMQFQFDRYKAQTLPRQVSLRDRFDGLRQNESNTSVRHQRIPVPLIFTTNFDRALERILEANDLCFHTVFPVVKGNKPGDEHRPASPSWLVRTHCPNTQHTTSEWWKVCNGDGLPKLTFKGPVIVKLHGSPSLDLEDSGIQHWVVLSEFSYLQALTHRAPAWFDQQLTGGFRKELRRSLKFLGHSISDWNVRLGLYPDSWEHRLAGRARRSAVTQDIDRYRNAVLDSLGIDQHVGDLNDFPGIVLRFFEDPALEKSDGVTKLICKLAELS